MDILDNWDDINNEIIFKHIILPRSKPNNYTNDNKNDLFTEVNSRLNSRYIKSDISSVINTLTYLFYHIRSGIYVKIENNKLVAFIPFANKYYTNNWSKHIKFDTGVNSNLQEFINDRNRSFKYEKNYITNIKKWWCNAYIVNNEVWDEVWGQHSLLEYESMLIETTKQFKLKNCEFFINKRDHPVLHNKLREPYLHMFPKDINGETPLIPKEYFINNFAPILSSYTNANFLDIPFVIPTDWELAIGNSPYKNNIIDWDSKKEIAFWRGSATGSTSLARNQRLQITKIDNIYRKRNIKLIDAGIVSWNTRDKIHFSKLLNRPVLTFIKIKKLKKEGINLKNRVPMHDQMQYKYILNIDGHSNPNRTSYLLKNNSLILQVESEYVVGNVTWFTHLIKPYVHYVPIKFDFSNLEHQIEWCKNNDDKCKEIVNNANNLYNTYLAKRGICEYISKVINLI